MGKRIQKDYFVLHNGRDYQGDTIHFDNCKYFADAQSARMYAFGHLPACIAKGAPMTPEDEALLRDKDFPYLVVGDKEHSLYYMGEFEGISHSYVAQRSSSDNLENTIKEISEKEKVKCTFAGIELRLA